MFRREWTKLPQNHFRAAYDGFVGSLKVPNSNKSELILKFYAISNIFVFNNKIKKIYTALYFVALYISRPIDISEIGTHFN